MYEEILKNFPNRIKEEICKESFEELEEIRIRSNRPIFLKFTNKERIINIKIITQDILEILQRVCDNSIYSYQSQIREGFITIKGGHRIGISGNVVIDDTGKIQNINYISGLNFRISRQIIGVSNPVIQYLINQAENTIFNTLIISPPGAGKTTLLRDIVRNISNGIDKIDFKGKNVGVVDERGEIAALFKGVPENAVGMRTDVMDNCPKSIGMKMMIRSMAPEVIVADEIGKKEDVEAINYAVCCGIKGIFTAHGASVKELELNPIISGLINKKIIERLIVLDPRKKGSIEKIYFLNKQNKEYELLNKI